jgi:hypothetical protein
MLDINDLPILLVKDITPEYFTLPKNQSYNYSPVIDTDKYYYNTVSFLRRDVTCFIKLKAADKWLYENPDGTLEFKYLQLDKNGFATFILPCIFWFDYLEVPTFTMYRPVKYGVNYFLHLVCEKTNNGGINLHWTNVSSQATRFFYDIIQWKEYLTENIAAKVFFTKTNKLKDIDPYIRK